MSTSVFLDALCPPATKELGSNLHHHRHGHTAVVESVSRTVGRLRASMGKGRHKAACRWIPKRSQVSAPEPICVALSVSVVTNPTPSAILYLESGAVASVCFIQECCHRIFSSFLA